MALKFYTSVAERLELKIRNIWVLIIMFEEVTGKNCSKGTPALIGGFKKVYDTHVSQLEKTLSPCIPKIYGTPCI